MCTEPTGTGEGEGPAGPLTIAECQERIDGALLTIRYILDVSYSYADVMRLREGGVGVPGSDDDDIANNVDFVYVVEIATGETEQMIYNEFLTAEALGLYRLADIGESRRARELSTDPLAHPVPA